MNYGKAMQTLREENKLSRREMAEKLGVTPSALWKIEAGKTTPKSATIRVFCFSLKVPVARLYTLAFERADFAPVPSVQDCIEAMDALRLDAPANILP